MGTRIRQGVANDRRIRITDPEMRHTPASPRQRHDFEGYKRPIAQDLDEPLTLAAEVLSANPPDTPGLVPPLIAVELQQRRATSLPLDQGYVGG